MKFVMSTFQTANDSGASSDSFVSLCSGEVPSKPTSVLEQPTETNFSVTEISSILPVMNFFVETSTTFDLSITPTHSRESVSPVKACTDAAVEAAGVALPVETEEEITCEATAPQTSTEEPPQSPVRDAVQEPISPPPFPLSETPPASDSSSSVTSPVGSPIELSDDEEEDEQEPLDQTRMERRKSADPDRRLTSVLLEDGDSDVEKMVSPVVSILRN